MIKTLSPLAIAILCLWSLAPGAAARLEPPSSAALGVWAHPGTFGADRNKALPRIRETLDEYVKAGIDTVILMIKGTDGYVYYDSAIGIRDPAFNWDFLDAFLKEARPRGITVHPWFCVFPEAGIVGRVRQHPEWLIAGRHHEMVAVANPALPEVREYERSLMLEVVRKYPIHWIHLDYIRFPCEPAEPYFSFDSATRSLFKDYSGWDPAAIKAQDSGNMIWNAWIEWNREQVTAFVGELRESLKKVGRPVQISAAVFPDADNARVLIGQDWAAWAERGLVDMLCPMLYTNHEPFFREFVKRAVLRARGRCRVLAGIGIGTSHNQNTPEGMLKQMEIGRELGADGAIFFSSSSLTEPFLARLKERR